VGIDNLELADISQLNATTLFSYVEEQIKIKLEVGSFS
jgi:hypothetical protein